MAIGQVKCSKLGQMNKYWAYMNCENSDSVVDPIFYYKNYLRKKMIMYMLGNCDGKKIRIE